MHVSGGATFHILITVTKQYQTFQLCLALNFPTDHIVLQPLERLILGGASWAACALAAVRLLLAVGWN